MYKPYQDTDPEETQEWIESIEGAIQEHGTERARFLLEKLIDFAERQGARMPFNTNTPFINTIQPFEQKPFPGDRSIERRIKSLVRWNAMAMVTRANKESDGIGGHISTFASSATLLEVAFNHFLKGPDHPSGADLVFFQGHASPGIYSRAFLEGRLTESHLENFRRELSKNGGLSSYPHPWLMPDFWQFPTVSMGLTSIMALYQARFMHYLEDRGLGAITLASREKLDNLLFVVNCNLQRLDGPVRGNGKIIQELEGTFRGAGWNVIKVIWGSDWDVLFEKDSSGALAKRLEEVVDGELLKYVVAGGEYFRKNFFGKYPELLDMVKDISNEDLLRLRLGGHDPEKVYAAYAEAAEHKGKPTVILARTIKGYGLGEAGEGRNITHQQKKLNEEELLNFRDRFNMPFYKPPEDSDELIYLREKRNKLGGYLPFRNKQSQKLKIPEISLFEEALNGYGDREISTTMAFVRLLTKLAKDKDIGKHIVPIIPDEGRTFGMEALFRQLGIYSHSGQLYEPVDSDQFLYYKEEIDGQILEEGINEPGAMSSFIAAGTAYSNHKVAMIPFYIYYSMFGFQRVWDLIWAAGDIRARGFLLGATAGRTTLNGEGLQHQDGHSHLAAAATPNIKAYDLAYAYEIAIVLRKGIKEMFYEQKDVIYYLTLQNENYIHPKMPKGAEKDIINGMYKIRTTKNPVIRLLGSGSLINETLKGADLLKQDWGINAGVWNVTSFSELRREAEETERWNLIHPDKRQKKSHLEKSLSKNKVPTVAVSDYVKMVAEQIGSYVPGDYYALGTDGFGRSDTRENLRHFFEVDRYYIVLTAIRALVNAGAVDAAMSKKVIKKYGIDPNKPSPITL